MEFTTSQKKAHDLRRNLSLTASAGSGKTAVLVSRYLKLLIDEKLSPSELVAITFTEKAAREMRHRIAKKVDELSENSDYVDRLGKIRDELTSAPISTIHSFCSQIIRNNSLFLGVELAYGMIDTTDQMILQSEIIDDTLNAIARKPENRKIYAHLVKVLSSVGKNKTKDLLEMMLKKRELTEVLSREFYSLSDEELFENWREIERSESAKNSANKYLLSVMRSLLPIYLRTSDEYQLRKARLGVLDFDDLLLKVRDFLRSKNVATERLIDRYSHIMVDEYQDTNFLQYEIINLLTKDLEHGNLLIVGDPQQSIYSFRGADVRVFDRTRDELTNKQQQYSQEFRWNGTQLRTTRRELRGDLRLQENFRMLKNPMDFTNAVFEAVMGESPTNQFEVEQIPLRQGRNNDRSLGHVELLFPEEGLEEYELLTARIKNLMESDTKVWERTDKGEISRPINYGDIAILIRSRTKLPQFEQAMLADDIPYKVHSGIGFYNQQIIYDIVNYLSFLINQNNDIALSGILRAPFFGISDVDLFEISQIQNHITLWEKLQNYENRSAKIAVEILRRHISASRHLSNAMLIRKICGDTAMAATLSVGRDGAQQQANYEKLLSIARNLDNLGFTDIRKFLKRLNKLIQMKDREGQGAINLTKEQVQLMTIHAAKGLEFPIVILPNAGQNFQAPKEPFISEEAGLAFNLRPRMTNQNLHPIELLKFWRSLKKSERKKITPSITEHVRKVEKRKSIAEEKRIFYVAVTRARDRLIISGKRPKKTGENWLKWLCSLMPDGKKFPTDVKIIRSLEDLKNEETVETEQKRQTSTERKISLSIDIDKNLSHEVDQATFNVTELAEYVQQPDRFWRKYRFGISDEINLDSFYKRAGSFQQLGEIATSKINDERNGSNELDPQLFGEKVHDYLARIGNLEDYATISENLKNPAIEAHLQNFVKSEIGQMALSSTENRSECTIQAIVGNSLITGRIDRIFKNSKDLWQLIDYKTDKIDDLSSISDRVSYHMPQIELYALLFHKLNPAQPVIETTIFFTSIGKGESIKFSAEKLMQIEKLWLDRIGDILR